MLQQFDFNLPQEIPSEGTVVLFFCICSAYIRKVGNSEGRLSRTVGRASGTGTQKQLRTSEAGERHGDLSPEKMWTTTHRNSLHCLAKISCIRRNSSQPVEIAINDNN